jgi:catechol 2,3-dioxygenase-like lactoylglutathione lyase family enzyme
MTARWSWLVLIASWAAILPAPAAEIAKPTVDLAIYGHVAKVGWVVKDLDRTVDYWEKLGLRNVRRLGVREYPDVTYRGKKTPLTLKVAVTDIRGIEVEWIQPVKGHSDYDEFLKTFGDGIHHLAFRVRTPAQLDEQVAYFKERGVDVIQQGSWKAANGAGQYAYLDTAGRGGGFTMALAFDPDGAPHGSEVLSTHEYPLNKITHYAFMVRDMKKVDAFYQSLGFGGMAIDHNISLNRIYRGEPGKFEMYLGWWRWGSVPIEWIETIAGPNIYEEHLEKHGEGFHHFGLDVKDMDEGIKLLGARGAPASQLAGWDNPRAVGRATYLDTEPVGGVVAELIWNQPKEK